MLLAWAWRDPQRHEGEISDAISLRCSTVADDFLQSSICATIQFAQQSNSAAWSKCTQACGYKTIMTAQEQAKVAACMQKCDDQYAAKK